jgi:DNA-binding NarL/FixJ family response regulator
VEGPDVRFVSAVPPGGWPPKCSQAVDHAACATSVDPREDHRVAAPDGLTEREIEILRLIAQGLTNPEIAARLFLSTHTIKTHVNRIFAKTGSRDRAAAAIEYAHRHQLC